MGLLKSSDHVAVDVGHVAVKIITTHVVGHHQIMSCAWGRGGRAMAANMEKDEELRRRRRRNVIIHMHLVARVWSVQGFVHIVN